MRKWIRRYWLLIPIEAALIVTVKAAWGQQSIAWRQWSEWYLRQPVPDMNMAGVGTGVLQEPFLPLFWVGVSAGLSVLTVCFPMMWHAKVKRQLVKLCPKCGGRMVRGNMVRESDNTVRIRKVCPKCGIGELV